MKYINVILLFLLSIFFSNYSQADDLVISELQKGGKIVFIRHSLASECLINTIFPPF